MRHRRNIPPSRLAEELSTTRYSRRSTSGILPRRQPKLRVVNPAFFRLGTASLSKHIRYIRRKFNSLTNEMLPYKHNPPGHAPPAPLARHSLRSDQDVDKIKRLLPKNLLYTLCYPMDPVPTYHPPHLVGRGEESYVIISGAAVSSVTHCQHLVSERQRDSLVIVQAQSSTYATQVQIRTQQGRRSLQRKRKNTRIARITHRNNRAHYGRNKSRSNN